MKAEEPASALYTVEGRVPFDRLTYAGHGANNKLVKATPDFAFPARHGCDVRLHRNITVGLRNLRIAAREERRLASHALPAALPCGRHRFLKHLAGRSHADAWHAAQPWVQKTNPRKNPTGL